MPTNEDAADVSRAIRERLKARGQLGTDEVTKKAIDQRGETYNLPIATGDRLRLFRRTWATVDGLGGYIGNNGSVVEVLGRTDTGLWLRDKDGRIGEVEWRRMADERTGRLLLGFGHAVTIDAAQGITSGEHIAAFPRGTAGVTAFKAYVAESRAKGATWTMIAEGSVMEAVKRSRALGDASPVTLADLWNRVATDMANKPYKALGMDLARAARAGLEHAVDTFIQQSHCFQKMEAEGRNPGQEMRRHVRDLTAIREMAGHGAALNGAMRRNDDALQGVGQELAAQERGQRVRAFVQQQSDGVKAGDNPGGEARRLVQAEAVRRTLARHVAGLNEALQRNAQNLRGLGQDIDAHLRGLRVDAEASQRKVDAAVRKPSSSPSPGM